MTLEVATVLQDMYIDSFYESSSMLFATNLILIISVLLRWDYYTWEQIKI